MNDLKKLSAVTLTTLARSTGYKDADFMTSEFKRMNSHGEFIYDVSFKDTHTGKVTLSQIYITSDNGSLCLEY